MSLTDPLSWIGHVGRMVRPGRAEGLVDEARQAARAGVDSIPSFTENGFLPPGIHETSLGAFALRFGTENARRRDLMAVFYESLVKLRAAGLDVVDVGGSFVTNKHRPNDIDAHATWIAGNPREQLAAPFGSSGFKPGFSFENDAIDHITNEMVRGVHVYTAQSRLNATNMREAFPASEFPGGPFFHEFFQRNREGEQIGMMRIGLQRDTTDGALLARSA